METKQDFPMLLVEMQKGTFSPENSLAVCYKVKTHTPYHQAIPYLGIYSREMRIYIHPKLETIQMSFKNE